MGLSSPESRSTVSKSSSASTDFKLQRYFRKKRKTLTNLDNLLIINRTIQISPSSDKKHVCIHMPRHTSAWKGSIKEALRFYRFIAPRVYMCVWRGGACHNAQVGNSVGLFSPPNTSWVWKQDSGFQVCAFTHRKLLTFWKSRTEFLSWMFKHSVYFIKMQRLTGKFWSGLHRVQS